jgi:hypothetical protein
MFATLVIRLITLNGMKASEEISDEQSRQVAITSASIRISLIAYFAADV